MTNDTHAVLRTLFELAQADVHADLAIVAERVGHSCSRTDAELCALERQGLVNAARVRLTLMGLAVAASLPALTTDTLTRQGPTARAHAEPPANLVPPSRRSTTRAA